MQGKKCIAAALFLSGFFLYSMLPAETELNNTPATANALDANGSQSGTLGDSIASGVYDDYDWYSLTLPSDGHLTLTATASGTGAAVEIWLYRKVDSMNLMNPTGDYIGSGYGTWDTLKDNLHAGTYYIQISRSGKPSYTLTSSFTAAAFGNDPEMDDTPKVAATLAPNMITTGHLGYYSTALRYDTYDWYKITTTGDGRLTITTQTSDGDLDLQPYIYRHVTNMSDPNSAGDYVSPTGNAIYDTVTDLLRAGTYYIQLVRRSGVGSYTLNLTFTAAALANDAENDDTPKVAITIAPNTTTTGHLGYYSYALGNDNYDWYKVTTPSDGRLTVITQTSDGNLDLQPYIFRQVTNISDPNSAGDYTSPTGNTVNDTVTDHLRAGTYYIQLVRRSGSGSYTMYETFTAAALANDAEPDDIPNQSQTIPLDSMRTGHLGYYSNALGSDNYDWFKVVVPAARTLRFTSLTTDGDLDLQLYLYTNVSDMTVSNPGGTWVTGGGNQLRDTVSATVSAGNYYLQVLRRSGVGSYTLTCGSAVSTGVQPKPVAGAITPSLSAKTDRLNGHLVVRYTLAEPATAQIELYNIKGMMVASARKGFESTGSHQMIFGDRVIAPGLYYCRLRAGKLSLSQVVKISR